MEQKNSKIFNSETKQAVSDFCSANNIDDIDNFIYLCFKQGFDIKKYGFLGKTLNEDEEHLKMGVIQEKRVEIPVEVIKEVIKEVEKIVEVPVDRVVEVIKEVPVEKVVIKEIIKEVPIEKVVTKIEYVSDKTGENELILKIQQLEKEMSKKDENLDELRHNLDVILNKPPVEIIKEVEVIKEVEKPNEKMGMLQDTLLSLRKELQTKNERIKDLEKINRDLENINAPQQGAVFLRGSNLNSRI